MSIQIADSLDQADHGASATGLNITAKVELALDLWLSEMAGASDQRELMAARVAQLDGLLTTDDASAPIN
ncbi:MAG: hypothetical protein ABSH33_00630 [Steroidobacteraceae bacterium]|jgi:hypothetical protein